jgi:hypothetical protein
MNITLKKTYMSITNEKDVWFDWDKAIELLLNANIDLKQFEYTRPEVEKIYEVSFNENGHFQCKQVTENVFYEIEFDCDVNFDIDLTETSYDINFCEFEKLSFQGIDFTDCVLDEPDENWIYQEFELRVIDYLSKSNR